MKQEDIEKMMKENPELSMMAEELTMLHNMEPEKLIKYLESMPKKAMIGLCVTLIMAMKGAIEELNGSQLPIGGPSMN